MCMNVGSDWEDSRRTPMNRSVNEWINEWTDTGVSLPDCRRQDGDPESHEHSLSCFICQGDLICLSYGSWKRSCQPAGRPQARRRSRRPPSSRRPWTAREFIWHPAAFLTRYRLFWYPASFPIHRDSIYSDTLHLFIAKATSRTPLFHTDTLQGEPLV